MKPPLLLRSATIGTYTSVRENVKHNLTRCKCFVKSPRARGMAGKGGLWSYVPSAKPKVNRIPRSRARRPAASTTTIPSPAPTDATEICEEGFFEAGSLALSPIADSVDACWIPTSSNVEDALPTRSGPVPEAFSIPVMIPLFTQGGSEAIMANADFSPQWMPFAGPHGYEFGTAGHFRNSNPQQVQSMPPFPSNLFAAGTGSLPTDHYAADSYEHAQFSS
ncbi:hypothetical protein FS837_006707 [Tulasnella sp. UAMH 9824]|nr:hypothetical protein FS837_006707 [Tulasnella sp. UAMH 9824]